MKAIYKKRMLKLADFLDRLPKTRFDIGHWQEQGFKPADCGSTACAMGWACTIPSFRRAGLHIDHRFENTPAYKDFLGFGAARCFFGISIDDAEQLFSHGGYATKRDPLGFDATPKRVANKLRKYVKEHA